MTDDQAVPLPDDAVSPVAKVLYYQIRRDLDGARFIECNRLAVLALMAAAPALRAQGAAAERERIRQLAIKHNAQVGTWHQQDHLRGKTTYSDFADLLEGDTDGS